MNQQILSRVNKSVVTWDEATNLATVDSKKYSFSSYHNVGETTSSNSDLPEKESIIYIQKKFAFFWRRMLWLYQTRTFLHSFEYIRYENHEDWCIACKRHSCSKLHSFGNICGVSRFTFEFFQSVQTKTVIVSRRFFRARFVDQPSDIDTADDRAQWMVYSPSTKVHRSNPPQPEFSVFCRSYCFHLALLIGYL